MKNLTLLLLLCLNQAVMAQPDMKPDTGTMPGKAFMGGDVHGSHGHFMSMPGAPIGASEAPFSRRPSSRK